LHYDSRIRLSINQSIELKEELVSSFFVIFAAKKTKKQ